LVTALLAHAPARAAEPERVVVTQRLYSTGGRFEASLLGGMSLNNKLTEHYLGWLQVAYNPSDSWAIEGSGLLSHARLNGVAVQARDAVYRQALLTGPDGQRVHAITDDFADLWQVSWGAILAGRWNPIYGKVNLASELQVHFNFFITAGGGALGLFRESIAYCIDGPGLGSDPNIDAQERSGTCGEYLQEESVRAAGMVGTGFRFWLGQRWALRAELRDLIFLDSYRVGIDRADAETGGDIETSSGEAEEPGVINVVQFLAGVTLFF
jgi:outer membrane beta-barrel protein